MKAIIIDDKLVCVRRTMKCVNWKEIDYETPLVSYSLHEALELIEKEDFDVVITDIKSIGIDGIKKIREVSGEQADIIIVSECDDFYYAKKAIELGVCAYLLKPLVKEELAEELMKCKERKLSTTFEEVQLLNKSFKGTINTIHPTIKKVIIYINRNYSEELSGQMIAEEFMINSSYLSFLFKKETGMNLNSFINICRLKNGKKMLLETTKRVNEIAYECGFYNSSYFSEQFKNYYGISPTEARRLNCIVETEVLNSFG